MGARDKLQTIANEWGEPLETLIPRLMNELGSIYRVAVFLDVYPNAVRNWLLKNGYKPNPKPGVWIKEDESVDHRKCTP